MSKVNIKHDSAEAKSDAAIFAHEQITRFSDEDWQRFFALLASPPEPTDRMKKAAVLYQAIVSAYEI